LICEIFFFQNSMVYYLLFYFFLFLTFSFQFRLSVNFYVFLFYGLEILSKNFGKLWNIFLKNRHLKSKILHKFHRLLFFFSILVIFFSYFTYPNLSKNSKSSFKKNIDVSKFFFSKFCSWLFVFFLFLIFYFQLRLFVLVNKF